MSGLSDPVEGSLDQRRALLWREETENAGPGPQVTSVIHGRAETRASIETTGSLLPQDEKKNRVSSPHSKTISIHITLQNEKKF